MAALPKPLLESGEGSANPGSFTCQCGRPIFFGNSLCLGCGAALGYDPELDQMFSLAPGPNGTTWRATNAPFLAGKHTNSYRQCANLTTAAACNWLIPQDGTTEDAPGALCVACRLNRTIPDLSLAINHEYWHRVEIAKRRLIASLLSLKLPVLSRSEDPVHGLAFDLLHSSPSDPSILTGHEDGVITLNIQEADDAFRERMRAQMHEPYRTLLGHFRHEIGHYYWDRLVQGTEWQAGFRQCFGDETQDYQAALQRYYQQGSPPDWQQHSVSAYATSHPWEDWAETWAHYLHIVDTLKTAQRFSLDVRSVEIRLEEFGPEALWEPGTQDADLFLDWINRWLRLTAVMNELSRSMGFADFYPFVLSRDAVAKLHLVHCVIQAQRG